MRMNFKRLALLGGHAARGIAKLVGLTSARLDFIALLVRGPLCQRDIADKLCVSQPVVSRMVRALMRDGFVKREVPNADRRYRMVSLTAFGRDEYVSLTDCEWFLPDDARVDVQGIGEALWSGHWEKGLEKMRLGLLSQIFEQDYTEELPAEPPFAAIRVHYRRGHYKEPLGAHDQDADVEWAWSVQAAAPRLSSGLARDALSDAYAAAWRPPRTAWGRYGDAPPWDKQPGF